MPTSDTPPLLRNSLWYAAAASAAATLGANAAEAQIVYTNVEPDATITGTSFLIDFDGDGESELSIRESATRDQVTLGTDEEAADFVDGIIGNGFAYGDDTYAYALPLEAGDEISAANSDFILLGNFAIPGQATFTFQGADPNGWLSAGEAFVGARFQLGEGTQHYAWVRVDVSQGSVRVLDYAYQSTPDTPIEAGDQGNPIATDPEALADGYRFSPVAPNPMRGTARFEVAVGRTEAVRVEVFDALGRSQAVLHDGALAGGAATPFTLDSGALPAGVYVVRVTGESFNTSRTMTVLR